MILKKKVNAQYISFNKVLYFPYKRPHPWLLVFEKKNYENYENTNK